MLMAFFVYFAFAPFIYYAAMYLLLRLLFSTILLDLIELFFIHILFGIVSMNKKLLPYFVRPLLHLRLPPVHQYGIKWLPWNVVHTSLFEKATKKSSKDQYGSASLLALSTVPPSRIQFAQKGILT